MRQHLPYIEITVDKTVGSKAVNEILNTSDYAETGYSMEDDRTDRINIRQKRKNFPFCSQKRKLSV